MTILRIDASSRADGSISRKLGDHLERALLACIPGAVVVRRDLMANPPAHIEAATIAGYYAPPDKMTAALRQATALSDELIDELRAADVLLVTAPMYNFSVPSVLKAWIDQVVRIGHTFSYDNGTFSGLMARKKAYVACAFGAGGYAAGQPMASANFLEPYLRFLLNFIGIADVAFFSAEATTADPETAAASLQSALNAIDRALVQVAA